MGLLQRFFRARRAWSGHFASNAAVAGYLFMINIITSPGFLWSLIPAFGMGIGLASHWSVYKSKTRKIMKQLKETGGNAARYLSGGCAQEKERPQDRYRKKKKSETLKTVRS